MEFWNYAKTPDRGVKDLMVCVCVCVRVCVEVGVYVRAFEYVGGRCRRRLVAFGCLCLCVQCARCLFLSVFAAVCWHGYSPAAVSPHVSALLILIMALQLFGGMLSPAVLLVWKHVYRLDSDP